MTMRKRLMQGLGLVALALFAAPSPSEAQVTIHSVRVTVTQGAKTVVYCDTSQVGLGAPACLAANSIWTLPGGGQPLAVGQQLILTQTGLIPGVGGNFDTSDLVDSNGTVSCTTCTVSILINSIAATVPAANPLNFKNADTGDATTNEAADWVAVTSGSTVYNLDLGYADNEHIPLGIPTSCADADHDCFPQTPWPNTASTFGSPTTFFLGNSSGATAQGLYCASNCYDAGALRITALQAPPTNDITITQGGWGAPPHGNNPGALLKADFSKVYPFGVTIGCPVGLHLTFTSAAAIQAFLPQGGTPGALAASATNPTTSAAGVFAGQVMALQLNVDFSGAGYLPKGLGGLHLVSGPLAGRTVQQVLTLANGVLGGCLALPTGMTISNLNDIVDAINENFDNGGNNGFLI